MNVLRRVRQSSWVARWLLAAWLFAMGTGWVNACVLQERPAVLHVPEAAEQHDPADAAAGCLHFCDDADSAVPKSQPPGADAGDLPLPPAMPSLSGWISDSLALPQPRAAAEWPPGPPLVLRFLRLTL